MADANGLSGSWAEEWLSLRREEGLDAAKDGALFLAVNGAGLFAKAKRSTSAMTKLVREILASAGVPIDGCRYTSHSGKATCLSWAAKFGLNHGFRRLLEGHAKLKDLSVLETALAPPWSSSGRFSIPPTPGDSSRILRGLAGSGYRTIS